MDLDAQPSDTDLVGIWQEAIDAVADLADSLDDAQWVSPTACPGWSVADLVAHVIDIEQHLAQMPRPEHEPDWDRLPHAQGDVGRFTEVGVDVRRGQRREDVVAELRRTIIVRREQLAEVPAGAEVLSPFGRPTTMQRLLRMRCLDMWMHEQDIRAAIGAPGGLGTRPAVITWQQIGVALPRVWAGTPGAPEGSSVRIVATGPGITGELTAGEGSPAVTVTLPWPDLVALCGGRVPSDDPDLRTRVTVTGDAAVGEALLPALGITP